MCCYTPSLDKLNSIYLGGENILAEFHSARQQEDEECARWSCPLEDNISKAQQRELVQSRKCDQMLMSMFFKGPILSCNITYTISVVHLTL